MTMVFSNKRLVRLLKPITHHDMHGTQTGHWPIGSIVEVSADHGTYWYGSPNVFKDEGELLDEPIDESFIKLSNN